MNLQMVTKRRKRSLVMGKSCVLVMRGVMRAKDRRP